MTVTAKTPFDSTVASTGGQEQAPSSIPKSGWSVPDFPSDEELAEVLPRLLRDRALVVNTAVAFTRECAGRYSTYPNEVVGCQLSDGRELHVLCKYANKHSHTGHGHRRGLEYETFVYRDVLEPLQMSTPRYYGSYRNAYGVDWLVMEYIRRAYTVNKGPQPASICATAEWIGTFHARCDARLPDDLKPSFIQYDREYYLGWGQRTLEYTAAVHEQHPWLPALCRGYEQFVDRYLALPRTLIHGEYTVHNVLVHGDGIVSPIDWESAALALAEIDLAIIIDGTWPADMQQMCVERYRRARWPSAARAPRDFAANLWAGELYNQMRWLGGRPQDTLLDKNAFRFAKLKTAGQQLGLI